MSNIAYESRPRSMRLFFAFLKRHMRLFVCSKLRMICMICDVMIVVAHFAGVLSEEVVFYGSLFIYPIREVVGDYTLVKYSLDSGFTTHLRIVGVSRLYYLLCSFLFSLIPIAVIHSISFISHGTMCLDIDVWEFMSYVALLHLVIMCLRCMMHLSHYKQRFGDNIVLIVACWIINVMIMLIWLKMTGFGPES